MRVFITGASRGIGRGLALAYGARGEFVHAGVRDPEAARLTATHLRVHHLDVTDETSCLRAARELEGAALDLLVNNAGVGDGWKGLDELDLAQALRAYDTNALGPLRVTRALLTNLRAARGKIIHVTSLMGSVADNQTGRAYGYRMSKAALNMASKNLALELRDAGVASIVVNPGWVQTDMGGPSATQPVDLAVSQLIALFDRLTIADTGKFFNATGEELPW